MPIILLGAMFGCTRINPVLRSSCHTFLKHSGSYWEGTLEIKSSALSFVLLWFASSSVSLYCDLICSHASLNIYSRNVQMFCCHPDPGAAVACCRAPACTDTTFAWHMHLCCGDECIYHPLIVANPLKVSLTLVWPIQKFHVATTDMKSWSNVLISPSDFKSSRRSENYLCKLKVSGQREHYFGPPLFIPACKLHEERLHLEPNPEPSFKEAIRQIVQVS